MAHTEVAIAYYIHPKALVETEDIGADTRIWAFAHVMAGAHIGEHCDICDHAFVESGARLGNNVTVKNGVALWDGITVEDDVFLGPHCVLTNDFNPRAYLKKTGASLEKTLIRCNATIGANATILCGITIGRFAFIGAGSTVIRSVPDYALMVGNPARQIGWMCRCSHKLLLGTSEKSRSKTQCPTCGASYRKSAEGLSELTISTEN
jgi:UDP-2-acetamido-3-amino-2,3-dideoxy-glucuronate N-acetyltransferase